MLHVTFSIQRSALVLLLVLAPLVSRGADGPPAPAAVFGYERDVLPLLRRRCGACHSAQKRKGRLEILTAAGLARGGKSGLALVRGKPAESLLLRRVVEEEMPPDEPLEAAEVELLRRWIAEGAQGLPEKGDAVSAATHWSFVPVRQPELPQLEDPKPVRGAVDVFIASRLEVENLTLSPESAPELLLRRLAFDLTGLPPSPEEIADFLADDSPDAYDRRVDRLLASPRHGERSGKHWLDAAGYADSNGYFHADSERPLAYRYRDYVIAAHNSDKPFDRFLWEQVAGDEIAGVVPEGDVLSEMVEPLVATHFLRNAQDGTGESDGNPLERKIDKLVVLEGVTEIVGSALLGLTVQCARCHDHKFEPLTQLDYYRLQAVFAAAYSVERWLKPNERVVSVATRAEREEHKRRSERADAQVAALKKGLEEFSTLLQKQLVDERLESLDAGVRESVRKALALEEAKRSTEDKALLAKHASLLEVKDEDVDRRFPERVRLRDETNVAVAAREKERPAPLERVSCLFETHPDPLPHFCLERGEYNAPREAVEPGVPVFLAGAGNDYRVERPSFAGAVASGRRSALAHWLTSPANPLVARVTVNRIWQHHFGTGIVSTPANLGLSGAAPSHPELLDWLAHRFVSGGWSLKGLHREVVTSAAYRQSSAPREEAERLDPEDRLLWRFPLRRLDAEAVRDAMLSAGGDLDLTMGGPAVVTKTAGEGQVTVDEAAPGARRRSVYLQQRRTQVLSLLEVFDAPVVTVNCTRRAESTVPLQSLAMLNSEFALACSSSLSRRLASEAASNGGTRLELGFLIAFGRKPEAEELSAAERFIERQEEEYSGRNDAGEKAWADFCQMLLAASAFLYVE